MRADKTIDCFGLLCPVPIIHTAKAMKEMRAGEVLEVSSTDAGIREDMPAWCRTTGHEFLGFEEEGEVIKAYVRKAA
jgi:TusA-related sulfurtransferase